MDDQAFDLLMKRFDSVDEEIKELRRQVNSLVGFRMWLLGLSAGVSGVVSFVFNYMR